MQPPRQKLHKKRGGFAWRWSYVGWTRRDRLWYLSLSLCVSRPLPLCLSASLPLCLSASLSLFLPLCLSLSLAVFCSTVLDLTRRQWARGKLVTTPLQCVYYSHSFERLCLSVSLSLCLSLCLSVSLCLSFNVAMQLAVIRIERIVSTTHLIQFLVLRD